MAVFQSRRSTATTLLVCALIGVISSTQTWLQFTIDPSVSAITALDVSGIDAQPLVFTLFLAIAAGVFALLLVSGWLRIAVLALIALLGAGAFAATWLTFGSVIATAGATLAQVLGFSDLPRIDDAVTAASFTPWMPISMVLAALIVGIAVFSVGPSRRWAQRGQRYSRAGQVNADARRGSEESGTSRHPDGLNDRIDDWDALTEGTDPTS